MNFKQYINEEFRAEVFTEELSNIFDMNTLKRIMATFSLTNINLHVAKIEDVSRNNINNYSGYILFCINPKENPGYVIINNSNNAVISKFNVSSKITNKKGFIDNSFKIYSIR